MKFMVLAALNRIKNVINVQTSVFTCKQKKIQWDNGKKTNTQVIQFGHVDPISLFNWIWINFFGEEKQKKNYFSS